MRFLSHKVLHKVLIMNDMQVFKWYSSGAVCYIFFVGFFV